jgi:hypothetical protein
MFFSPHLSNFTISRCPQDHSFAKQQARGMPKIMQHAFGPNTVSIELTMA